jgi:hypothetical protein
LVLAVGELAHRRGILYVAPERSVRRQAWDKLARNGT